MTGTGPLLDQTRMRWPVSVTISSPGITGGSRGSFWRVVGRGCEGSLPARPSASASELWRQIVPAATAMTSQDVFTSVNLIQGSG
jgi:hypothetical protein